MKGRTVHCVSARAQLARILCLSLLLSLLLPGQVQAAQTPSITAYSAVVMDYNTEEILYEKDADTLRVPASMTKVMTAYIIFEELEAGRLTLDTMVPISARNAEISRNQSSYPTAVPLPAGSSVSVETLLELILLPSASASCIVMAEYIAGSEAAFVQRMNETAARLGMTAQYKNCHGAHVHYITARSQAILVRECIQRFPQMLDYTSRTSMTFNGKTYANTNQLLPGAAFAYEGVDGFKTGTINAAGYCLSATAQRGSQRIITVVMHSSNNTTRHTDSQKLLDYGFRVLEERAPYADVAFHWSRDAVEQLDALGVELHPNGESFRPDQAVTRAEFTVMLYTALEQSGALPTVEPQPSPLPETTAEPESSPAPEAPSEPEDSPAPEATAEPESSPAPEATSEPEDSPAPEATAEPESTPAPEAPSEPAETPVPETTAEPEESPAPEATPQPEPSPAFADMEGHWAEAYISQAAALGLVSGVGQDRFAPDNPITRQEMMVLIDRFLGLPDANGLGFEDDGSIAFWALESAARVTAAGIFDGSGDQLMPTQSASRAEAVTVIVRLLEQI